jgi:hypothetical protein
MRTVGSAALAAALLWAGAGHGGKAAKEGIELEIRGTVRSGLVAIGGETTGTLIGTKDGFGCELQGVKGEDLNKKTAVVKGTLTVKEGVTLKRQRMILNVSIAEAAKDNPEENYAKAKIVGKIKTGVAAPGGATTGTTITANGITWELDTSKDKELAAAAEKLNGMTASVSGTVSVLKAKAAPPRPRTVVTVTEIKPAS